jgi:diketogulonate reductase-like aldo/keto reductase
MKAKLNNNIEMPLLGLGVYDMHEDEAVRAVEYALKTGYRLIDTASMYGNEKQVGEAVRKSDIRREEIFVTTKVNNTDHGYDSTLRAFENSMKKLDIGHIDLYLVHWPIRYKRKETWKALEHLYEQKMVRAIGVANYLIPFLEELETYANIIPAVNQVEFSPWLYLEELLETCSNKGITLQSYTPLVRGKKFDDPRIQQLCIKYGKTPAQIILRWNLQLGVSTIPKSSNPKRIEENFHIFDFEIAAEDMAILCRIDEGYRVVDDPMSFF